MRKVIFALAVCAVCAVLLAGCKVQEKKAPATRPAATASQEAPQVEQPKVAEPEAEVSTATTVEANTFSSQLGFTFEMAQGCIALDFPHPTYGDPSVEVRYSNSAELALSLTLRPFSGTARDYIQTGPIKQITSDPLCIDKRYVDLEAKIPGAKKDGSLHYKETKLGKGYLLVMISTLEDNTLRFTRGLYVQHDGGVLIIATTVTVADEKAAKALPESTWAAWTTCVSSIMREK